MYERDTERRTRQNREKRLREKRRRRRKKKLLRALLIILLIMALVFLLAGGIFLGRFIAETITVGNMELPWGAGSVDIMLDAGHGGKDQGASYKDVLEKEITLEITEKAKEILEEAGYRVGMVREDDTFVELQERADYANGKNAKVFVSIHCNSLEKGQADGVETYYAESKEEDSRELAQAVQTGVIEETQALDREIKTADYVVILETEMPAALVEVGFLSDSRERELLQQEEYQKKLAEGIAAGIIEYLKESDGVYQK